MCTSNDLRSVNFIFFCASCIMFGLVIFIGIKISLSDSECLFLYVCMRVIKDFKTLNAFHLSERSSPKVLWIIDDSLIKKVRE